MPNSRLSPHSQRKLVELSAAEPVILTIVPALPNIMTAGDSDLLRKVQEGDEPAFECLFARYQPPVYRYALRMTGSPSMADDVVQETFLQLIRGARGYDPSLGPLASYLYGIARHAISRQLKYSDAEDLPAEEPGVDLDPLDDLAREERISLVRDTILSLPLAYREVLVLCDLEELDYARAAETLGCPVGTIRSRLSRARAHLAARLSQGRVNA